MWTIYIYIALTYATHGKLPDLGKKLVKVILRQEMFNFYRFTNAKWTYTARAGNFFSARSQAPAWECGIGISSFKLGA